MVVAIAIAFAATCASVQYLIARHRMTAFMMGKWNGGEPTNIRIDSIHLTDRWSVTVEWECSLKSDPENQAAVYTETSWLGLGWTRVPILPGWRE